MTGEAAALACGFSQEPAHCRDGHEARGLVAVLESAVVAGARRRFRGGRFYLAVTAAGGMVLARPIVLPAAGAVAGVVAIE